MIRLSTGLRSGIATGGSLYDLLNECLLRVYSGPEPASANADLGSAVLLCEVSAGGTGDPLEFESTAVDGVLVKSAAQVWTGDNLDDGDPLFFRLVKVADTGTSSTTEVRLQGSSGGLGKDMFIASLPLASGAPLTFRVFQLTIPEM